MTVFFKLFVMIKRIEATEKAIELINILKEKLSYLKMFT